MSITCSVDLADYKFDNGNNATVARFIEEYPSSVSNLKFNVTHGASNFIATPYPGGSVAVCGRFLVYIKAPSFIVMNAESGRLIHSQISEYERGEGIQILNQHRTQMCACVVRGDAQPIPREEVVQPQVIVPRAVAPMTAEQMEQQIQERVQKAIEARAREEEARKAKEAAEALAKVREAEVEQLKLELAKLERERAAEAQKKAFEQSVAARVAEICPASQVVPLRQASPVNMENVGGYILAAIFAILAIYIALKGNAAPQYEIPRRSDNDDTFKMMFAAIMQERFRPPAEVVPSSVRQIEPPAATKELLMPEHYIGSWTSIGWIVCFVCALPTIFPLLAACCCSSFDWFVVRYFANDFVADYNEKRAKIKSAAKRYDDDDWGN